MATMKAIQIKEFNAPLFLSTDVPKPKPKPHQVLIRIKAGGFCHSDVMIMDNEYGSKLPYIGSHEPAGIIEELGSDVKGYKVGDKVGALAWESVCGKCPDCKSGQPKYCDDQPMKGIFSDGAWAEYLAADAAWLVPIPESIPFSTAATFMCAGCTMYGAIATANVPKGGSVAIIGIGGLGHIGTQIAKAKGYTVIAVDPKQAALDLAMSFKNKPDVCMNPESDSVESILEKLGPDKYGFMGVDAVIFATDAKPAFRTGLNLTKKHGTAVLVGQPEEGITLSYHDLIFRDIHLVGTKLSTAEQGKELIDLVEKQGIEVHIKEWKPEQAEEMRQEYLSGTSKGRNVIVF